MTRINTINPSLLTDQHLRAEYLEYLFALSILERSKNTNIPDKYVLGEGHILFFKNKLLYLKERHELIKEEMNRRGFTTKITLTFDKFSSDLFNDYIPDLRAKRINLERIVDRINLKPTWYRYHKNPIPSWMTSLESYWEKILITN
ncbi:MAG: pyrimidine dimer DNA glycosylase/endonuclease V [Candidatus Micrarchaeaceae archaeon]